MAFDAGSIISKLLLDTSPYAEGILQAQAASAVFPAIVIEFLENPLLGFIQVAKDAAEFVKSSIEGIAASFHQVGLAAERAGVSVEWLSRLQANASTAGVGLSELVSGFKILEKQAELASEGDAAAAKGFARLGISAQEAAGLMATPQALFDRVKDSIDGISDPSQRTAAALGVLGRQGFNLVPVLTQSRSEMDSFANTIEGLGGTVSESDAKIGADFGKLETILSAAWTGIKKAIAEPIFEALGGDLDTVVGKIEAFAESIRSGISEAFKVLGPIVSGVWQVVKGLSETIGSVLTPVFTALLPVLKVVGDILGFIFDLVGKILSGIGSVVSGVTDAFGITDPTARAAADAKSQQQRAGGFHFHAHVDGVDAESASTLAASKLLPHIKTAQEQQKRQISSGATHSAVSRSLGGKH